MSPSHDPIERLAAADPLRDGELLTESEQREADMLLARILAEEPERAPRRRTRRWLVAVAATACGAALAVTAIDVLDEGGSGPSVVDRAVAAVTDDNAIYHMVARIRIIPITGGAPHNTHQWGYIESWYGPNNTTHSKGYEFDNGRKGRLRFESADRLHRRPNGAFGGLGVIYDPIENTITHTRFGRSAHDPVPTPEPNSDPGAGMRRLEREGRLHLAGSERFAGRKVYRLASGPVRRRGGGLDRFTYLVDAETYYPVFFRWVSSGGGIKTVSEARYLTYERLPYDAQGRKLLDMDPHPGAKESPNSLDSSGGSGGR
jgi:hypothetical protein